VLEQNAGKDVTKLFKSLHPPNTLRKFLTEDQLIGRIDVDEVTKIGGGKNAEDVRIELARKELRNVETVRSLRSPSFPPTLLTHPRFHRRSSALMSSRSSPSPS